MPEPASPSPPLCRRVERRGDGPVDASADGGADVATASPPVPPVAGTITLDETDRHRRRLAMTSDEGIAFVLSLDATTLLRDGDRLVLDDGRRLLVRAAPEPLHEVRAKDAHHLLRLAWHMGNRHLPTQLMGDHLRIRRDAVIGRMLVGLGAELRDVDAGFDPEGGAYGDTARASAAGHEHPHPHGRPQDHDDGSEHEHPHDREQAHDHG